MPRRLEPDVYFGGNPDRTLKSTVRAIARLGRARTHRIPAGEAEEFIAKVRKKMPDRELAANAVVTIAFAAKGGQRKQRPRKAKESAQLALDLDGRPAA